MKRTNNKQTQTMQKIILYLEATEHCAHSEWRINTTHTAWTSKYTQRQQEHTADIALQTVQSQTVSIQF